MTSHIEDIVEFKYRAINKLLSSKDVMALVSDNPDIDLDSDEIEQWEEHIKDYDYVDDTTVKDGAYIMVEAEMSSLDTSTMKTMTVYVQVVCSKGYMDLSKAKFKGVRGNRRDNIVRQCDAVLSGDIGFGVGAIRLNNVAISSVPSAYTSVIMTYRVPNFA